MKGPMLKSFESIFSLICTCDYCDPDTVKLMLQTVSSNLNNIFYKKIICSQNINQKVLKVKYFEV
jgi:hypothetical protein